MRRFEFAEGTSNKFWEIEQDGSDLNIRWGRIGTQGQSQTKNFADAAKAAAAMQKLIDEKSGKGYAETGVGAGAIGKTAAKPQDPPPSPAAPAPAATPAAAADDAPATAPVGAAVAAPAVDAAAPPQPASQADGTPPWLAHGAPVELHADVAPNALASRRFPRPLPLLDADAWWKRTIEGVRDGLTPDVAGTEPAWRAALEETWTRLDGGPRDGSFASDVTLLLLCYAFASAYAYGQRYLGEAVVHYLVARHGLVGAVDVLLAAQAQTAQLEWRSSPAGRIVRVTHDVDEALGAGSYWAWHVVDQAFRAHLAAAPQDVWDACADRIEAAIPSVSPARQAVLAMLLPERPEISNRLLLAWGTNAPGNAHWMQVTATDPAALAIARRTASGTYATFWQAPTAVATVLQERGLDALDLLLPGAAQEATGRALACLGVPEAIDALARAASTDKAALLRFAAAAARWPQAALFALSRLVASGSKEGSLVAPTLTRLVQDHAHELPALRPWLGAAGAAAVDRILAQLAGPTEVAAVDELPPVLARPPWLAPKKKAGPAALALEPLPLAPVEQWEPGARERALELNAWQARQVAGYGSDPAKLAAATGLGRGSDAARVAAGARAIAQGDVAALIQLWRDAARDDHYMTLDACALAHLPGSMGVPMWNALAGEAPYSHNAPYIVARYGLDVLPGLLAEMRRRPAELLPLSLQFGSVEWASAMARNFAKLKTFRDTARAWLLKFPEHAACGLIAPALGKAGEARDCAGVALRLLAAHGHGALLTDVAARYGEPQVQAALAAVLAEDPLERYPAKRAALPAFWLPRGWRRPVLAAGPGQGKALADDALDHLGTMLAFPSSEGLYPGIAQVREACTRESLANFAWDLFAAWLNHGAPAKEGWALTALGWFGNDDTARRLTPYLRAWPGEAAHARAVAGLDVLAAIGTDVALMLLNGIAQKLKFKGLQDKAREKIAEIADARGLTTEELEDRLAPDLGLDEAGTLVLDFGPRRFRVGFDEALKPYVRDADGARLPDLPKPKKTDDEALAAAAVERYKLLKKDARTIASQQVLRLEVAMCTRRRWDTATFGTFLAAHPLLKHLVQRLVWGVYEVDGGGNYGGQLRACFRVAEDGSCSTAADDPYDLPSGPTVRVGIPHALELPPDVAAAFGQVFADYELLQPFAQLGRDTHALTAAELAGDKLVRWDGATVPTGRVLGLVNKGWRRGQAQDGGCIWYFNKPLGADKVIELRLEPGIIVGMVDEFPEQTLHEVQVGPPSPWGELKQPEALSLLDPISASELIRDLEALRA